MIQNCQQFEVRLQELLDARIDPETDEWICRHSKQCAECHESLMAFSLLHSNFLNDSDSMKIKLENLAVLQSLNQEVPKSSRKKNLVSILASLAAMLLLGFFMIPQAWLGGSSQPSMVANHSSNPKIEVAGLQKARVEMSSWNPIRESFRHIEIYSYSEDLPGINSIRALSVCFDWLQRSLLPTSKPAQKEVDSHRIHQIHQNLGRMLTPHLAFSSDQMPFDFCQLC